MEKKILKEWLNTVREREREFNTLFYLSVVLARNIKPIPLLPTHIHTHTCTHTHAHAAQTH